MADYQLCNHFFKLFLPLKWWVYKKTLNTTENKIGVNLGKKIHLKKDL